MGNHMLLAARQLGWERIAVAWVDDDDKTAAARALADNRTAELGSYDDALLAAMLGQISDDLELLAATSYSEDDLLALLNGGRKPGLTDPDDVPETAPAITKLGDLWLLGSHRVMCGDSTVPTDVERLMNGTVPSLMVTDPPYGVEYDPAWRNRALGEANRAVGRVANDDQADWRSAYALFPGDVVYVWHAGTKASQVADGLAACGFEVRSQIIWAKQHFAISRGHYHVQHEPCWYAVRKGRTAHWNGDRTQSTLWQVNNGLSQGGPRKAEDSVTGHGTQKPVEIMRRPIENHTLASQSVYDPFLGSGSTLIAAEIAHRTCLGIDIEPHYVDIVCRRYQDFAGTKPVLESTGEPQDFTG